MSLNWDCTRCKDSIPADDEEDSDLEFLIWSSLSVDMGGITEENVKEWQFRFIVLGKVGLLHTVPDVRLIERWVGLRTNVSTLSRKRWLKKVIERVERRVLDTMHLSESKASS